MVSRLREVEQRIDGVSPPAGSLAACEAPALDTGALTDSTLYAPEVFPDVLRAQRKWWTAQFAYLLQRLSETPEGDGSMLDHSICVLVTEVSDGNTHSHDDLPVMVAGGAGGYWSTGRLLDLGYRRHGDLWVSVANALGDRITRFGDASSGPIPGL